MVQVNGVEPHGVKRGEKVRQTRRRMIDAARDLFLAQGYGATTLQDVADRAGVALQTVCLAFRDKRTLLKEVVDAAVAGEGGSAAAGDQPPFRNPKTAPSAPAHLRVHVANTRTFMGRVAPMAPVVTAAAAVDPEVAGLWPGPDRRHVVHTAAAESLMAKPGAHPDVPVHVAADVLYGVLSPELYLLFVENRGWPPARYEEWAYATLHAQLCDPAEPPAPQPAA